MRILSLLGAIVLVSACGGQPAANAPGASPTASPPARPELLLATTTSTQDSGLLDVLIPEFEKKTGYKVKTTAVGTGAALALGAKGDADVLLVHAPSAEEDFMKGGNAERRLLVMHNDFIVVGPASDPAHVRGLRALDAFKVIAAAKATFISRGDNSGTDQLEKALWKETGIDPKGQSWLVSSGQGMGATLTLADQKNSYTITDRATYLARKSTLQSGVLVEGDRVLLNIYHVMPVNPAKFPGVKINVEGGRAFARFMVAPDTQRVIGEFGKEKYGQALFFPDAGKREEEVG